MDVLLGSHSLQERTPPRLEMIDPPFYRVLITTKLLDGKLATPAIVGKRHHRRRTQILWILPVEYPARDLVMTIRKHICFDKHCVTNYALDGKSSAIDF